MTMTLGAPAPGVTLAHRDLISDQLWRRMVARIALDEDMDVASAERILNEALGFLRCLADHPEAGLSPSPLVDIGWHTFIVYTRDYAAFCDQYAGRFIHHLPSDDPETAPDHIPPVATVDLMVQLGYPVDRSLWATEGPATCGGGSTGTGTGTGTHTGTHSSTGWQPTFNAMGQLGAGLG